MPPAAFQKTLKELFGFEGFRPGQEQALRAVAAGRDSLVLMPTGGGKSLCYQIPALSQSGLTLVVSPLQALMKDQVEALKARGASGVEYLNGLLDAAESGQRLEALARGELRLLYVAPERFASPAFRGALRKNELKLIAVDEAHCISSWGHDFRPEYREIGVTLRELPGVVRMALTATATPRVRKDIAEQLELRSPELVVLSFDRPNLRFEVEHCPKTEKEARVVALAKSIEGSMLVYCGKRADTEELADRLRRRGIKALAYHAGMESEERHRVQEAFLEDKARVVCATVAFGMGIDKPDVRAVVHHRHPASLEAYYQEAGRAGRDGRPSRCIALVAPKDAGLHEFLIAQSFPTLEEHRRIYALLRQGVSASNIPSQDEELGDSKVKVALRALEKAGYVERVSGFRFEARMPKEPGPLDLREHEAQREHAFALLDAMRGYLEEKKCLRAAMLRYFGEKPSFKKCESCSACDGETLQRSKSRRKEIEAPDCPRCESPMQRRYSKSTGPFWGCSQYPDCRGTLDF